MGAHMGAHGRGGATARVSKRFLNIKVENAVIALIAYVQSGKKRKANNSRPSPVHAFANRSGPQNQYRER
jgi:hypothetical protein